MDQEVSISDYAVSGGKIAIMLVIDAVTHQLPGVQGHELSAQKDSYVDCLLECPHYTCPEQYWRHQLPKILLAAKSQGDSPLAPLKQALGRTWERRLDQLEVRAMTPGKEDLLAEYLLEQDQDFPCGLAITGAQP